MVERFIKTKLSKKDLEMAEKFGGSDFADWQEYEENDNIPFFDKEHHALRSIANDPNHLKYWKKEKNKYGKT